MTARFAARRWGGRRATLCARAGLRARCMCRRAQAEVSSSGAAPQVGQYIQSRGGVVAAEELAPYLDVSAGALADAREGAYVDEGYVVPALVRFGGQPEVGPDGELLYRFPSLQRTARAQVRARRPGEPLLPHGSDLHCCLHPGRDSVGRRALHPRSRPRSAARSTCSIACVAGSRAGPVWKPA